MKRITLQDIAEHLKLSRSTVCRGLRDHPKTSQETRRRIREKCAELGYRPDPVLSEMAAARWKNTAAGRETAVAYIVCPDPTGYGKGSKQAAFVQEAAKAGYKLDIFRREEFRSSSQLEKVLRSRGITNVIVGTVYERSLAVEFDWSKFIAVQFLPGFHALPLHSLIRDHFNSVVTAWQKAVERGYRRIGAVFLDHGGMIMDDVLRRGGADACQRYLFPHLPAIRQLWPRRYDAAHWKDFFGWVRVEKPDVIIGFNDVHRMAFQAKFSHNIPYINLHPAPADSLSGIQEASSEDYARTALNLLGFCRTTHQWGIPAQRIDYVMKPNWFERDSLPSKHPGSP